jgi:hypothetical protein
MPCSKNDTLQITPDILAFISQIDEFRGSWRVLGYSEVLYSSLESILERNKAKHVLALRQTQSTIRTDKPIGSLGSSSSPYHCARK